jgi:hypothetical protein
MVDDKGRRKTGKKEEKEEMPTTLDGYFFKNNTNLG